MYRQPYNDNAPVTSLADLRDASRRWLAKPEHLGPLDFSASALDRTLDTILPKAIVGDAYFFPEDWVQCLSHLERLLPPLAEEKLLELEAAAYGAMIVLMEEQGLELTVTHAVRQFRQHEPWLSAKIADGTTTPALAVESGILVGLEAAFESELPILPEIIRASRKLIGYSTEPQHETLPQQRWLGLNKIIDMGCQRISTGPALRLPAEVVPFKPSLIPGSKPPQPR